MNTEETLQVEIVGNDALATIERAQTDVQITTARKFPRTLSKVKERMLSFATLDEETAASCFYTLPARRGGDDKPIQGPSVRMAEIALASYQHVKAGSRIINDDGKFIVAQAVVHDLENNVAVSIEVRRRVTNKRGERFSDDMIAVTGNAACSIALRNAVFRVVPRALINPVVESAKRVAVGDVKSLTAKRSQVLARLKQMGAKETSILSSVGAEKVEDIDLAKLEILIGLGTSIKDGEVSLEDAFPTAVQESKPIFAKREIQAEIPPTVSPAPASTENDAASAPQAEQPTTPQQELSAIVTGAGFTFEQFIQFADKMSLLDGPVTQWSEISDANAKRCISAKAGMLRALKGAAK